MSPAATDAPVRATVPKTRTAKVQTPRRAAQPRGTGTGPAPAIDRRAIRQAANRIKMASDATRLTVLLVLAESERNVSDLCGGMGMSQPAVSHHLALLRHGNMIECRRDGKSNIYSLTDQGRRAAEFARGMIG